MKPSTPHWPYPLLWAHRGAGRRAPENTLAAFRVGAQYGFRGFECDVKVSADDKAFLLHDTTLDRTTSGAGVASDRPWRELAVLDAGSWHGLPFAGEPLASLSAVAEFVLRNGHALNLEIKPTPGHEERTGRLVAAEVQRLWAGQSRKPLLSSFHPESLRSASNVAPELPLALLIDTLWPEWFEVAMQLGCVAVVTEHRLMDEALLRQLHSSGLRALVYTVNDRAELERLLNLPGGGVDGIITDAVDTLQPDSADESLSA